MSNGASVGWLPLPVESPQNSTAEEEVGLRRPKFSQSKSEELVFLLWRYEEDWLQMNVSVVVILLVPSCSHQKTVLDSNGGDTGSQSTIQPDKACRHRISFPDMLLIV